MLRALILIVLIGGMVLLALPFFVSSFYVDQRGITIPGQVFSQREDVTVHNSTWKRSCQVTIEYSPPDTSSVAFFTVPLLPDQYDSFRTGQPVALHYLPRKDIPTLPLASILREMHALPMVRLADRGTFSSLEASLTPGVVKACLLFAGIVVLLIVWRRSRLPGFAWAVAICVVLVLAAALVSEFPTPEPRPTIDVRRASGKVKSVERIDRLFEGSRTRGVIADQPIAVVGVEFVPMGRTQPVLAVDLIDDGSLPGLKQDSVVDIDYESGSPRTAYIQNATRDFVARNLRGITLTGVLSLGVLVIFLVGAHYLGRGYNRLLTRRK